MPPPRETLLETERVLKRATKEQLSSSMTGEMPAKEQMEKLERALQKCVQMQKATAADDVKRERLLKKLETVLDGEIRRGDDRSVRVICERVSHEEFGYRRVVDDSSVLAVV